MNIIILYTCGIHIINYYPIRVNTCHNLKFNSKNKLSTTRSGSNLALQKLELSCSVALLAQFSSSYIAEQLYNCLVEQQAGQISLIRSGDIYIFQTGIFLIRQRAGRETERTKIN